MSSKKNSSKVSQDPETVQAQPQKKKKKSENQKDQSQHQQLIQQEDNNPQPIEEVQRKRSSKIYQDPDQKERINSQSQINSIPSKKDLNDQDQDQLINQPQDEDLIKQLQQMIRKIKEQPEQENIEERDIEDQFNIEELERILQQDKTEQQDKRNPNKYFTYGFDDENQEFDVEENQEVINYDLDDQDEQQKQDDYCKKFCRGLKKVLLIPIQGLEYIFDGGQKSNKMFMQRIVMKEESTQEKNREYGKCQAISEFGGKLFRYAFIPWLVIVLISSFLCIMNLILWSYYRIGVFNDPLLENYLIITDYILVILFVFELLFNIYFSVDIDEIFDFENFLLLIIIFEIVWNNTNQPIQKVLYFIHSLRSLRVSKLRVVTRLFSKYFNRFINNFMNDDLTLEDGNEFDEEEEINKFIIEQMINFTGGILVETSFLLALDRSLNFKTFAPYADDETEKLDYLRSTYFVVISISTIGYGDIYPVHVWSRLVMVVLLIVNITVMSNFLGNLIQQIFEISPYNKEYDFKDHVVIIGELETDELGDFLEELVENDVVERSVDILAQIANGIKCIIVNSNEPNYSIKSRSEYLSDLHDNEIVFLKEDIYAIHRKWYKKANLREAKILIAFAKVSRDPLQCYAQDQLMAITAKNTKEDFPNLRVNLVLNSDFKNQIDKDTFFNDVETISKRQMNEFIMASSLENPSLCTTIQHMFTMKSKVVKSDILRIAEFDEFLYCYIRDMQSEIYSLRIPDTFVGMTFRKLTQFFYFYNLDGNVDQFDENKLIQNKNMRDNNFVIFFAIETIQDDNFYSMEDSSQSNEEQKNSLMDKQSLYYLDNIDVPSPRKITSPQNNAEQKLFDTGGRYKDNDNKSQILINPQQYNIRKNDIAYVICNNIQIAKELENIQTINTEKYAQFVKMYESIKTNIGNKQQRNQILSQLFFEIEDRFENQDVVGLQKRMTVFKPDEVVQTETIPNYYNLNDLDLPEIKLTNHIIIFGKQHSFPNLLWILRKYSNRQVVLFTSEDVDIQKWIDLCYQTSQIYYYKADFLDLKHYKIANVVQSYQVLIKSDLMDNENFPDAIGLCVARILSDYFDFNNFLIEISDGDKIIFLDQNPKLKHVQTGFLLKLPFMQGNVHFQSMPIAVLARIVYNQSWFRLFQNIVIPKIRGRKVVNQTINSIKITKEAQDTFKYFGILQFALMESDPSLIAISLIKQKLGSKYQELTINKLLSKEQKKRMMKEFKSIEKWECNLRNVEYDKHKTKEKFHEYVQQLLGRSIGTKYVFTNPHFYTPIEEGDKVLVIGSYKLHNQQNSRVQEQGLNNVEKEQKQVKDKSIQFEQRQKLKDSINKELKKRMKIYEKMGEQFQEFIDTYL